MEKEYKNILRLNNKIDFLKGEIRKLQLKVKDYESEKKQTEQDIVTYYQATGMLNEEIITEDNVKLRFSLTKPKGTLVIDDDKKVPADYVEYQPKIDKVKLKEFLKDKDLSKYGCSLEYGEPSVTYKAVK